MKRYFLNSKILGTVLAVSIALSGACSSHSDSGNPDAAVPTGALMSAKPARFGIQTANNLNRSLAVATGIDPKLNAAISTRFDTVLPNLSANGGIDASGPMLQSAMDFAASFAIALVTRETGMTMSDPARVVPLDLKTSIRVNSTAYDTLNDTAATGLIKALVLNLTGVPATVKQTAALLAAVKEFKGLVSLTDTSANHASDNLFSGKQLVVSYLITIILSAGYWS